MDEAENQLAFPDELSIAIREDRATIPGILVALREHIDAIATAIIDERTLLGKMPWELTGKETSDEWKIKLWRRRLEIFKISREKALLLEGAGSALALFYQERIVAVTRQLGSHAGWNGTPAGLDLIIEESTPDHATGDARAKRQFARDAVPALRAAGVSDADIMEIAARTSMRPRIAAAISKTIRDDLAPGDREKQVRQAALDARTLTTRAFDERWRDMAVDVIEYDEERITGNLWRRVYLMSNRQRALMDSALRARQRKSDMPFERVPTLTLVRKCMANGNWQRVLVAALPEDAFLLLDEIGRTPAGWNQLEFDNGGTARRVERAVGLLEEYNLIRQNGDGLWEIAT